MFVGIAVQNLGMWDRIFGTYRRQGRVYGVEVFGGKGALRPGARGDEPAPYVDYGRRATAAAKRLGSVS
jgi:hypothetical protein